MSAGDIPDLETTEASRPMKVAHPPNFNMGGMGSLYSLGKTTGYNPFSSSQTSEPPSLQEFSPTVPPPSMEPIHPPTQSPNHSLAPSPLGQPPPSMEPIHPPTQSPNCSLSHSSLGQPPPPKKRRISPPQNYHPQMQQHRPPPRMPGFSPIDTSAPRRPPPNHQPQHFPAHMSHQHHPPTQKRQPKKAEPRDLFDDTNERYMMCEPWSPIQSPTFSGPNLVAAWKKKQFEKIRQKLPRKFTNELNILDFCRPETNAKLLEILRTKLFDLVHVQPEYLNGNPHRKKRNRFKKRNFRKLPGPMPHTLMASHLDIIRSRKQDYLVCEKTDGVRYMFYIHSSHPVDAYFVSRSFDFFRIQEKLYCNLFQNCQGDTLIDGELIKIGEKVYYFIYDAVQVNGTSVKHMNLKQRLQKSGCIVSNIPYHQMQNPSNPPIIFYQKTFYESGQVNLVFDNLSKINGEYIYNGEKERAPTRKNDGIVFTLISAKYLMDANYSLLKWKWMDKSTIDFKVVDPFYDVDGKLLLYAGGDRGVLLLFSKSKLNSKEREVFESLKESMQMSGSGHDFIVECNFNFHTRTWVPINTRPDKVNPNFITTATNMLQVLVDSLTKEDLMKKLCAAPHPGTRQQPNHHHRPPPPNQIREN